MLSFFDGIGTAMQALVTLLLTLGQLHRFQGALFCKKEVHIAKRVQTHWAEQKDLIGSPAFHWHASDVWDRIRDGCKLLRNIPQLIPIGALLLLVGGSPCPQLTLGGKFRGQLGICGVDSVHFHVFPIVLFFIQLCRPDLLLHVVVENAGSLLDSFRRAMREALGLPCFSALRIVPAWTALERNRYWINSCGVTIDSFQQPETRQSPIAPGWAFRRDQGPPAMRNRGERGKLLRTAYFKRCWHNLLYLSARWNRVPT